MQKIYSLIGKIVFGLTVILVVLSENYWPGKVNPDLGVLILLGGFSFFILGFVFDDHARDKKIKAEKDKRQAWINSLYGR